MNADIPYLRCFVRNSFLNGGAGTEEAYAFAIQSYPGRALAFHVMLKSGAHYRGVPIHGLSLYEGAPPRDLPDCQLWDCFTSRPVVHVYNYLREHEALCYTRSGEYRGHYLFTVDWLPDDNGPGFTHLPEQNKCAHVLALTDGNLVALPTNRIAWMDGYFIGRHPDPRSRRYMAQEDTWHAESADWDVSGSTEYCYEPQDEPERPSWGTGVVGY
jgi:hypothetical protein